ncbi:MAG: 4-hydroxybenzoyl-CoA thioesterase [Bacteroidetes bacterium]|nr:4-hydroxybenzoyl-CoA thioesterase [Bacteroidota bacterium]
MGEVVCMTKSKELKASAKIKVRFNECDPLGIVWHGNYLKYFEEGREAFGEKYNFDYYDFYNKGYSTPVIHAETTFKKPLRYKDTAIVEVHFIRTEAAKIIFHYKIKNEAGDVICTGSTTQVFVTNGSMELSLTVPDFITDWMQEVGLK